MSSETKAELRNKQTITERSFNSSPLTIPLTCAIICVIFAVICRPNSECGGRDSDAKDDIGYHARTGKIGGAG